MRSYKLILTFSAVATGVMVLLPWRCSKKNYFKRNRTYLLNNLKQVLQVSNNSNIKYNIIQVN